MRYDEAIAYDAAWVYDEPRSLTQFLGGVSTGARKIKYVEFRRPEEPPGYEEVIQANAANVNIEPDKADYEADLTRDAIRTEFVKKRARNVAMMGAWL